MESVTISLLDSNEEVQYGLNWGQRDNRDPNQAYIQLTPDIYKGNFFPVKGKFFIVDTDDGNTIIFSRAQKDYGCALQTPENNSIIGKYLRKRLGVEYGAPITKKDIVSYGRSTITFKKIDDMHYQMDFAIPNDNEESKNLYLSPRQIIYYGAPGTGKSHKIKGLVNDGNHVRTTFHPDSDYASFVGAYKPTTVEIPTRDVSGHVILDNGNEVTEKKIVYEFVAQAFLQAYTEAWKRSVGIMTDREGRDVPMPEGADSRYYLVIEEINRGNCAQIFGDLFQLLDRDDCGESSYAIRPDQDIKRYLAEQFKDINALPEAIRRGEEMKLPANLYIFATMNTSDQSLFPIDSAFKRRWDWEYVPIKDEKKGYYVKVGDTAYLWSDFLEKINEMILRSTQSDDKQMGYWFVHLPEGQKEISTDKFVGKVLFYLWNDVFKDFGDGEYNIFIGEKTDGSKYELRFKSFFGDERNERIRDLMRANKIDPTEIEDDEEEEHHILEEETTSETDIQNNVAKKRIRILLADGSTIEEPRIVDTYAKYLERFDPEEINALGIEAHGLPLLSENRLTGDENPKNYQQKKLSNGWWAESHENVEGFKSILNKVIQGLNQEGDSVEIYLA